MDTIRLMVHLDRIVLDITAQAGPAICWATCCAIANLLYNNGPLAGIVNLLNQILAQL